jgi:hypothetical protein
MPIITRLKGEARLHLLPLTSKKVKGEKAWISMNAQFAVIDTTPQRAIRKMISSQEHLSKNCLMTGFVRCVEQVRMRLRRLVKDYRLCSLVEICCSVKRLEGRRRPYRERLLLSKYESISLLLFPEVLGYPVRYVHSPNPAIVCGDLLSLIHYHASHINFSSRFRRAHST